ncbi:MAG: hypothetical protein PHI32_07365, partial [Dysgonamonadaceae bacterium]|nr:hypothetical protein [Dysgonamonadaceae bacterium]
KKLERVMLILPSYTKIRLQLSIEICAHCGKLSHKGSFLTDFIKKMLLERPKSFLPSKIGRTRDENAIFH